MNTSRWGPKGWRYLHAIAEDYDRENLNKKKYREFFTILQDILPCIYCRKSYKNFIKELPVSVPLQDWLYEIHNKVNNKLRDQGLFTTKNPSLQYVKNKYAKIMDKGDLREMNNMWYFWYSIACNYDPEKHSKNKYKKFFQLGMETVPYYNNFITILAKNALKRYPMSRDIFKNNHTLTTWLFNIHSYINRELGIRMQSYGQICKTYEKIRASCNKNSHTCRN